MVCLKRCISLPNTVLICFPKVHRSIDFYPVNNMTWVAKSYCVTAQHMYRTTGDVANQIHTSRNQLLFVIITI